MVTLIDYGIGSQVAGTLIDSGTGIVLQVMATLINYGIVL